MLIGLGDRIAGMTGEGENSGEPDKPAVDLGIAHTMDVDAGRGGRQLKPGERFANRYTIGNLLGQGGAGSVYAALDTVFQTPVALKLIRADRLANPEACTRLLQEAALMRNIRHDNIVVVYDANIDNGQPYITMEKLDGQSLRAWMREQLANDRDCSLETAVQIISAVLSGLELAHSQGITHRDLKPENVFLTAPPGPDGARLKLLDFGLARAANSSRDASSSMGVGTPLYMAPEQATAPEAARAPADFYALSVMFYELLVGVPSRGQHELISETRPEIPRAIDDLINKGLSQDRKRRPQTVAEYRAALLAATDTPETRKARADRELKARGPEAMRQHAETLYRGGAGNQVDFPEALRWFMAAGEAGDAFATRTAGAMLWHGKGVERDLIKARQWFERAAKGGNPKGMYDFADVLRKGEGGPADLEAARSWFLKSANAGSVEAMTSSGDMLAGGEGGPVDAVGAAAWYRKAAAGGDPGAMYALGRLLETAAGGAVDLAGARAGFVKAAEAGNPQAMIRLGKMLEAGEGGPVDLSMAAAWLVKAGTAYLTADETSWAQTQLKVINAKLQAAANREKAAKARQEALSLFDGDKIKSDPVKARALFQTAAELGDAMSMSNLGWMLDHAQGGPADIPGAREWFHKAAEAGLPVGMTNYAHFNLQGRGGPRDPVVARLWYVKAAAAGDKEAEASLKQMDAPPPPPPPGPSPADLRRRADALYKQGKGTAAEIAEAVKFYVEAGNGGDVDAMNALGRMARWGEGVQRNSDSARTWFRNGAEAGDPYAQYMLGWMLKNGEANEGWKVDLQGAEQWLRKASDAGEVRATTMLGDMMTGEARYKLYQKAAEAGWTGAMTKLGKLLLTGATGVPHDKNAAKVWIGKAAASGDQEAQKLLKEKF
jgi:TPR repeat protein/tRNA A-37 threonylcarbamoyl transferase component Bud32